MDLRRYGITTITEDGYHTRSPVDPRSESGGYMVSADREFITGVRGKSPQWGPGAEQSP